MRILLVEDDKNLCELLRMQLEEQGLATDTCSDGLDAWYLIRERTHDLVLLDRMLPSMDGLTLLHKMRKEQMTVPVILITALGELKDRVTGLDSGADDYLVKPFAFEELMARIRCIIRRPQILSLSDVLSFGDLTYRPEEKLLTGPGSSCRLSRREGSLMEAFLRNSRQILTRSFLIGNVWGSDADIEDGNLDNYIHFLRRRLALVGTSVRIQAVRGVGYRLEDTNV